MRGGTIGTSCGVIIVKRSLLAVFLAVTAIVAALPLAAAPADKSLQNLKGAVSYQVPGAGPHAIAQKATITLADNDTAITGANSVAALDLPDTSRVLIGQNARVQLAFFNQTKIANAKFIVYKGNVRFTVEHPKGARANYVFQTQTAQIAVRGTVGDIEDSPTQLQVNVYSLSSPNLPVQLTLANGKIVTLHAGQAFVGHIAAGVITSTQIVNVSKLLTQPFTEFNTLTTLHSASLITTALAHPLVAIPIVAGSAVVVNSLVKSTAGPTATATPSAVPSATPTATPIATPTPTPTPVPGTIIIMGASPSPHAPPTMMPPSPHTPAPAPPAPPKPPAPPGGGPGGPPRGFPGGPTHPHTPAP